MLKKIIKYNTFTAIIIAVAFVAVASAMAANGDVKKVLGEEIVEKSGVDNSLLLATGLDDFDLEMEITGVAEDINNDTPHPDPLSRGEGDDDGAEIPPAPFAKGGDGNYYIDYQYRTLGIQDDVWQEIFRQKQLTISKAALEGRDLGLYVTEELGEIIDYEIAYLKEVQKNENEKGETYITEKTIYTGLIGLVLNTKTKELPGYEPVVKPPVAEETQETTPTPPSQGGDDYDDFTGAPEDNDYVIDSFYYQWLIDNCLSNNLYWYNDTCNAEPEPTTPTPPSQGGDTGSPDESQESSADAFTCDADHPTLCDAEVICEEMNLYWYGGECHLEENEGNQGNQENLILN